MIPVSVDVNQIKYPVRFDQALTADSPQVRNFFYDRIIPILGRFNALELWKRLIGTSDIHYAWGMENINQLMQHNPNPIIDAKREILLTILHDRTIIQFNGIWYGVLKKWCVDPFIFEGDDPKELLTAICDDLINRPPVLWEWIDYRQLPPNKL